MTQTMATPSAITFALDGDCDEALTSVVAVGETEPRGLGALEALTAYLYEDLRALAQANPEALVEALVEALRAPEEAAEDVNLFLKLVCADLEQLMREQHIQAIALVVCGADIAEPERRTVRYRALYRVERPADMDDEDGGGTLPPLTRRVSRRSLAAHLVDGAELALLLDWTRQAVKRGTILRRPPYQFLWVRAAVAQIEDERLPVGQPGLAAPSGVGGWHVAAVAGL